MFNKVIKGVSDIVDVVKDHLSKKASNTELGHVKPDGSTITVDTNGTIKASTASLDTHTAKVASTTELGHVKVDGETITIDSDGVISSAGGGGGDQDIYTATSTDGLNYAVTLPDVSELYAGLRFYIKPSTSNTGSARLDVNGTGSKFITYANANPLNTTQFSSLGIYDILYNGSQYQVMNSPFGMLDSYDSTSVTVAPTAKALNDVYNMKADKALSASIALSGQNGWTSTSTVFKDNFGVVHLQVILTKGTGVVTSFATPVITLPAGYRPTATVYIATSGTDAQGNTPYVGTLYISNAGVVMLNYVPNASQFTILGNVSFKAS